jgi:cytochrome bd ubiquinol oxidase subunit II
VNLNIVWFILIMVLFSGFFFLEGFDYGVGILLPFLGKNDVERRQIIASIGPFWDGNEVWLLTAGGAMFAAFPNWYATLFSGFYLALVLILLALIGRGVAFEFRSKHDDPRWRATWDWVIFGGSAVPALLWGVALANILEGVPIDAQMNYTGGFFNLLNPVALLAGLASISLFTLHGAIFLVLKAPEGLAKRAEVITNQLGAPAVGLTALMAVLAYVGANTANRNGGWTILVLLIAAAALISAGYFFRARKHLIAFALMGAGIVFGVFSYFTDLFPRVMVSSTTAANSLTIYTASSSSYTLTVMTVVAAIFVPIVLVYQAWNYYIFRERVSVHTSAH